MTGQPWPRQGSVYWAAGVTLGGCPFVDASASLSRRQSLPGREAKRLPDSRAVEAPGRPSLVHAVPRLRSRTVRSSTRLPVPTYLLHRFLAYQVAAAMERTEAVSPSARRTTGSATGRPTTGNHATGRDA